MYKLPKGTADPSLTTIEVRLASLVIPDPLEIPVFVPETPVETIANQLVEVAGDSLPPEENSAAWGFSFFLPSFARAENEFSPQATEETPALLAEENPPPSEGILPLEKKRFSSSRKHSRAGGREGGNESSVADLRTRKTPERIANEPPSPPPLPAAGPLLSASDLSEAASRFRDLLPQPEGKAQTPASSRDSSPEISGVETKNSAPKVAVHAFPSLLNDKVQDFISFFQGKAGPFFTRSLARSQAYEEMMKKIFREKNLPEDLFYLALIESGYNPTALSRAKASGIWQFIGQTAKRFGLRVDKWVDERRDPEKSTLAAAEYLKTLHGMFNNWDLATASYNAGEGKMLTAMKKAQSDDFWEISNHRYLKQETKKYVPMFLAAMTIAKEPQKYGFSNIEYHPPLVYEKVAVPPSTSLALIAKAAETDLSEIHSLNPALLREKTPPNLPYFEINLPSGKKEVFENNFPSLSRSSGSKNTYRVRSGDTLSRLAKKYNVSVQELCGANALTPQSRLKPGSILKIPQ
jgi:membrane-bound lytic murein transglycosylase D